jgi:hypothetical protein
MSIEQTRIGLEGLGHVLKDKKLRVPRYQRSYAWKETNVDELIADLRNALDDDRDEYFLGSIVCTLPQQGDDRLEIVDGQQRLATTAVIIAAVRDHFLAAGDQERGQEIEQTFLAQRDLRKRDLAPRLYLNENDHEFFQQTVLTRPSDRKKDLTPCRESHRRISAAYDCAVRHIAELAKRGKDAEDIIDLLEYMVDRAKIILFALPDTQHAFVVFETLNDRGLDLAISDLLKNFLFLQADNRIGEAQNAWQTMQATIDPLGDERVTTDFIRHLWASQNGATRERDLYANIKKKITSKVKALEFATHLEKGAVYYAALLNPQHSLWTNLGTEAREHVLLISTLKMVQIRPLLLAVMAKFTAAEQKKALRIMVSWGVRFLVTGGHGAGTLEEAYANAAQEISQETIKNTGQLIAKMARVVPNDATFKQAFEIVAVPRSFLARYYLRAIERQLAGEKHPELVPNPNEEDINLEHVLPQSPGAAWAHIPADVHESHYQRLGNLALMQADKNNKLGNKGFADKIKVLSTSVYQTTKDISTKTVWNASEIEARQKQLAASALKVWPLK